MRGLAAGISVATAVGLAAITIPANAQESPAVTVERDVVYRTVDAEPLGADVYLPSEDGDDRPAVLLVHGGGWSRGDRMEHEEQGHLLAEAGFVAVSVDYRFAPAHPYPAAVDDVQAAVRWLRKKAQRNAYGIDPDRIGALGSSAGGHLVGLLAVLGEGRLDRRARVAAVVAWSGPMDLARAAAHIDVGDVLILGDALMEFLVCSPGNCNDETAWEASPLTHVDATDAPMLLVNSEQELVPLRLVQPMPDALAAAGVDHRLLTLPGNRHSGQFALDVWDDTLSFLEEHLEP
jgi:acetyl esterase/lipase